MQYEYDSTGDLSSLVVLTFLLVVLVPVTYRKLRPKRSSKLTTTPFPVKVENDEKVNQVTSSRPAQTSVIANFSPVYAFLVAGWAVVIYLGYKAATTKRETSFWNPYDILGISESATEKEIKKLYKKLSIKFHPDKVRLAVNQTLEDVQEQFVDITKAYKALTDEDIRKNFLEYGHPDGKQDMSLGIALPSWMVEGGQSLWVLATYCLALLVGLPVLVGRWWYRSASITKDGLLNATAERYFRGIDDDLTTDQLITLLCNAAELDMLPVPLNEIDQLAKEIKTVTGDDIPSGPSKRVETLLRAHMARIPLKATSLAVAQQMVLDKILSLHKGLLSALLAYGYLATSLQLMELAPRIVQATLPGDANILQLPFIDRTQAKAFAELAGDLDMRELLLMEDDTRKNALNLDADHYNQVMKVAKALPTIETSRVEFKVAGDKDITPNAIVHMVFKLRRAGGPALKESELVEADDDEGDVEAILKADQKLASTAVPDTLSWAPYFPSPPKNSFWVFMADLKQDRIIVGPLNADDIGEGIRTFKLQFQAPPNAGLYTFQGHVKSDTYLGMDEVIHMQLNVVEESLLNVDKTEDDISDPDEDTLAGQMAAMKGGSVRKISREYESSSDEDLSDSESDSDSD